jgi:hypothetical protein
VKIELKPRKKEATAPAPEALTEEEVQRREREKAELLASLGQKPRPTAKASEPTPAPRAEESLRASEVGYDDETAPDVIPPEPARESAATVPDVSAATTERKEIEAQLAALTQQLAAAKFKEKQAQQQAIIAAQQQAQALGREHLAPLQPRLARHLAEVSRIQRAYGPTLKDFARSMASDFDPQIRRKISDVYRAAAPLGQRLGEARATVESAIRGLALAMESAQSHVHSQASVLAESALSISTLELETSCKTLVQLRNELRPGYQVHAVTNDHIVAPSLAPRPHIVSADFGPSLTD